MVSVYGDVPSLLVAAAPDPHREAPIMFRVLLSPQPVFQFSSTLLLLLASLVVVVVVVVVSEMYCSSEKGTDSN